MEKQVYYFQIINEDGYQEVEKRDLSRKIRFNKSFSKYFSFQLEFPFKEFKISKTVEKILDNLLKTYGLEEHRDIYMQLGIQYQYNIIKKYNDNSSEEDKNMLKEFISAETELRRIKMILSDDINSTEDIVKISFTPKSTSKEVVRTSNFFALFSITQHLKELLTDEFLDSYKTKVKIDKISEITLKEMLYLEVNKSFSDREEKIKFIVIFCHIFQIPIIRKDFSICNLNETSLDSFYNKRSYNAVSTAIKRNKK